MHKDLGTRRTVIDSRCVSEDGIRCYGLIPTVDVEGRETRLEVFPERISTRVACIASSMFEWTFDSINRYPTKEGTKTLIVNRSCGIGSFIDVILSMVGECRVDVGMINAIIKSDTRDDSRLMKRFYSAVVVTQLVKVSP